MAEAANDVVRAHGHVRGTQSFVQVMASIFKRPDLIATEIAWRAIAAIPFVLATPLLGVILGSMGMDVHWRAGWVQPISASFLKDYGSLLLHGAFVFGSYATGATWTILALVLWATFYGFVRSIVLRRLESRLAPQRATVIWLSILRVFSFSLVIYAWIWMLIVLASRMIWQHPEPAYVPAFALAVILTLLVFMLWSVVSWVFPLATTLAMSQRLSFAQSLRAAVSSRALRSKLIEINLVMGIVKVCLLVLAMVFSACPLPFSSVATQGFLNWWWFGCFLFWVIASDYFHVVRAAAVLRLTQAYGEA